jgi:hypothetical protein
MRRQLGELTGRIADRTARPRADPPVPTCKYRSHEHGTRLAQCAEMLIALFVLLLTGTLSALLDDRRRSSGILRIVATLPAFAAPLLVPPEHTLIRCFAALSAALIVVRAIDLSRDPRSFPLRIRLGLMFFVVDVREAVRVRARLDLARLGYCVLWAAIGVLALWLALSLSPSTNGMILRWIAGATGVYCMAEATFGLTVVLASLAGYRIPPPHDAPILSRSVREFWSRRWNLNVRDWLYRNCHLPLARRGFRSAGVAAAFLASTLVHFWMVLPPLGFGWALMMAAFFVIEGILTLLEPWLRLDRWPEIARRAWTVLAVLAPSPLFTEPVLRILA